MIRKQTKMTQSHIVFVHHWLLPFNAETFRSSFLRRMIYHAWEPAYSQDSTAPQTSIRLAPFVASQF